MATNLLDEFVVSIGLDPSAYTKGEREATDAFNKTKDAAVKSGKEIEERSKSTAEMFGKLRNQVVALFAVFTGGVGLKEFVSTMTASDAALGRMATGLGISTKTLSTYGLAAEAAGGSTQGMANAFSSLADNLQQWINTGSSQLPALFTALAREGGKAIDVNKPLPELLDTILEDLAKIAAVNPARATSFAKQFGLAEMVPFLTQGIEKFRELQKEMAKFAETKEQATAANELRMRWEMLKAEWQSVGRDLLTTLQPAMLNILDLLKQFADWAKQHPEAMKIAFEGITAAVVALSTAMAVGLVGPAIMRGFTILTALLRGVALALFGVDLAAAPLLATFALIAGAALLIYENWDFLGPWWHKLMHWMGDEIKWFDDLLTPLIKKFENSSFGKFMSKGAESGVNTFGGELPGAPMVDQGGRAGAGGGGAGTGGGAAGGPASTGTGRSGTTGSSGASASPRGATSPSETEAYIRQAAIARGIDPNIAVRVAKSEGLNSYVGDRGTSFGPFQLHYKNNIPGLSLGGLGDVFTKQTGLNARDPSTTRQQIDFALDQAAKGGWGPWHGWHGAPNAGIGRRPAPAAAAATLAPPSVWDKVAAQSSLATAAQSAATQGDVWNDNRRSAATNSTTSHEVNIHGGVNVNTQATDAGGIAKDFVASVIRAHKYGALDYGAKGP